MLGALYLAGRGVPQDIGEAYFWKYLAAKTDQERSDAMKIVSGQMPDIQIRALRRRAIAWKPVKPEETTTPAPPKDLK